MRSGEKQKGSGAAGGERGAVSDGILKHANIALFVPHMGCPHMCAFCNQRSITGTGAVRPSARDVVNAIEESLIKSGCGVLYREVAFFGGSFTSIPEEYTSELLDAALPYIKSGKIKGIRISTRPDAITGDILDNLKMRGVTAIELGAQSMDDGVLAANNRGHTCGDVVNALNAIKSEGFESGLQMMTGLYGSEREKDIFTAKKFAELKPDTVRIYPTAVMRGTRLADLYESGEYVPAGFEDTVDLCAEISEIFEKNEIKIIRLGLHGSEDFKKDMIAGVWHPAFGEICVGRVLANKILRDSCVKYSEAKKIILRVNPRDISKLTGHGKINQIKLKNAGCIVRAVWDENVKKGDFIAEEWNSE